MAGADEAAALADVVASGWVAQGPRVAEFERALSEWVGAAHGVAVSSGTAALHLSMLVLGLGPGDEVIVPSLSYIASANAPRAVDATPVFADIDAVHARCDPLGIAVVEDAACALGAVYHDRPIGSHSELVVFSYPISPTPSSRCAPGARPIGSVASESSSGSDCPLSGTRLWCIRARCCPERANPAVVFTHDDVVGDFATIAAGVRLAGGVTVGTGAYLGAGALVRERCTIGSWSVVGMGAVVLGDVPPGETWVGSPTARLRTLDSPPDTTRR
jgi:hypothetical protein